MSATRGDRRAIVRRPVAFLFDEPLSNLDAARRLEMRCELARIHEQLGVTTVYITHDQVEAMTLGQRIAVMHRGCVEQVDTPDRIYDRPRNRFVAEFIGSPSMNFIAGRWRQDESQTVLETKRGPLPIAEGSLPDAIDMGQDVLMGIRPEDIELLEATAENCISARISHLEPLGHEGLLYLQLLDQAITCRTPSWRNFAMRRKFLSGFGRTVSTFSRPTGNPSFGAGPRPIGLNRRDHETDIPQRQIMDDDGICIVTGRIVGGLARSGPFTQRPGQRPPRHQSISLGPER